MQAIHTQLPSTILETPRLLLKELTPELMTILYTSFSDPDIMQFLGLQKQEELETERDKFVQGLTMFSISFKNFLMIEKGTDKVIGRIGYRWWHVPHSRAELGYGMYGEENKQQGYMTEAINAIVQFGFTAMNLNRIEAFTGSRNIASQRLLERLGFTKEGLLREHYCNKGTIEDSICYSLLRSEFTLK